MFISKKRLQAIEEKLEKRTHVADFEFWRGEIMRLTAKVCALEEALGLSYAQIPAKTVYIKKDGPEREAQ